MLGPLGERIGSTYDVEVKREVWRGGTAMLQLHSAVDNAHLRVMVSALRRYWSRAAKSKLASEKDEVEWIAKISRDLARDRLHHRDTSANMASDLLATWNHGWPLASLDDQTRVLMNVSAASIDGALQFCARNLVLAITGDQEVVRTALAAPPPPAP